MKAAARPGSAPADLRHKERLHAEILAVREQKRKLEQSIAEREGKPAGWVPFPGPRPPSLPSTAPPLAAPPAPSPPEFRGGGPALSKRPGMSSMGNGGGEAKKPRVGSENADKAREDMWRNINKLLGKMWARAESVVFRVPVDPVADKVPDYFNVIKHPMDLGTIKAALARHAYATPADFAADVRLVFHNCRTYNPPGHAVTKSGDILSDLFEKQWLPIEQQWEALSEVQAPAAASASVQQQMDRLMPQYRDAVRKTAIPSMSSAQRPSSAAAAAERDMSFEEKRRLSVELTELNAERLSECLRIIAEQMPQLAAAAPGADGDSADEDDDGTREVEVDIDALSAETLWRLRDYISHPHAHHPRPGQQNHHHYGNGGGAGGGGGGGGGRGVNGGGVGTAFGQARSVGVTPGMSGGPAAAGSSQVQREREQPASAPASARPSATAPAAAAATRPAAAAAAAAAANGGRSGQHLKREPPDAGRSRGRSACDRGDGSDQDSEGGPHEVKGSTVDDHNPSSFVRPGAPSSAPVAESGIQSKNHKSFVGSQAARKADAPRVNSAAWGDMDSTPTPENGASGASTATVKGEEEEDGLWSEFKTREQVQQQKIQQAEDLKKAEEDRRAKEREDQMAGAKRQLEVEAERTRQLEAEVARQAAEVVAARKARKAQELQELQDRAGTAVNLQQPDDLLPDMDRNHAQTLTELGLTVKHSAYAVDFDD